MRRYRLTVAYDGTDYAGWQIQPDAVTVQERLEIALGEVDGARPRVHGSGRTDQGVHARAQVAHADLARPWTSAGLRRALNARLPGDIRVMSARRCAADFHARRSATGKEYRYFIRTGPVLPPCIRRYRTHVTRTLDVAAMRAAAHILVGRRDFAAFTANPNRVVETTVRDLRALEVRRRGHDTVLVARADGFLYKMVRSLAGFLIRVGEGAVGPETAGTILASRRRTARVPTAPPQGLFLWRVWY